MGADLPEGWSRAGRAVGAVGSTRVSPAARTARSLDPMCRNIHVLHNFEPSATDEEVHAAALQYVRKVSGTTRPSRANQEAFDRAVEEIAHATHHLLEALVTTAPPKDRDEFAAQRRARAEKRDATA
jgi:hypothetical protein